MTNYSSSAWSTFDPSYNDTPRVAHGTGKRTRANVSARMAPPTDTASAEPRVVPPITLAPITAKDVSDADLALDRTSTSQTAAEEFVKAALACRARKAAVARQSDTEAAELVAEARSKQEAKAKRLEMIRQVARRFESRR